MEVVIKAWVKDKIETDTSVLYWSIAKVVVARRSLLVRCMRPITMGLKNIYVEIIRAS